MLTARWLPLLAVSLSSTFAAVASAEPPRAPAPVAHEAPKAPAVKAPAAKAEAPKEAPKAEAPKAPAKPAFELKPQSSDPGIKIAAEGNRIVLRGTAEGPKVKYSPGIAFENGKPVKQVDYEVARGVSFQVDHSKMPDFSKDADYTRKNQWYFAHLADAGTKPGESAATVAQRLAASLNKGGAYKATVESTTDGATAINLAKR